MSKTLFFYDGFKIIFYFTENTILLRDLKFY